ncbi:MAG: NifU-like terminal domain [Pseudomonadota bacterium]|jgi:hypothetical protein
MADPLPPAIRARFASPARAGALAAGSSLVGAMGQRVGEAGEPAEGAWVRIALAPAGGRIAAARFAAYGCPWLLAASDWLCERLEGLPWPPPAPSTLPAAGAGEPLLPGLGGPLDWASQLGVPQARLTRLLLLEDALRAAFRSGEPVTG